MRFAMPTKSTHRIDLCFCIGHGTIDAFFGFIALAELHAKGGARRFGGIPPGDGSGPFWGTSSLVTDSGPPQKPPKRRTAKQQSEDHDMGQSLRSVYQAAVEEPIPPELLDLLSKLD